MEDKELNIRINAYYEIGGLLEKKYPHLARLIKEYAEAHATNDAVALLKTTRKIRGQG